MPYTPDVHVDNFLTNLSLAYSNEGYVGDDVFAPWSVDKRSDVYPIWGTESFKVYDNLRRPGTEALESRQTLTKGAYFAEQRAHKTLVTDAQKREADNPINPEIDGTTYVTEIVRNGRENDQLKVAGDPTQVTQNLALSGTSLWSDYTNSTPLVNIRSARSTVRASIHREPTDWLLSFDVALVLADHPSFKDLIKYTDPNSLEAGGLPSTVRGLTTHVSVADKDTSPYLSGASTYLPMFSKASLVYYRNPNPGIRTITFGLTFDAPDDTTGQRGLQILKDYQAKVRGTFVEAAMTYTPKVVAPLAGFLNSPSIS